jgi:hypothetical protein
MERLKIMNDCYIGYCSAKYRTVIIERSFSGAESSTYVLGESIVRI